MKSWTWAWPGKWISGIPSFGFSIYLTRPKSGLAFYAGSEPSQKNCSRSNIHFICILKVRLTILNILIRDMQKLDVAQTRFRPGRHYLDMKRWNVIWTRSGSAFYPSLGPSQNFFFAVLYIFLFVASLLNNLGYNNKSHAKIRHNTNKAQAWRINYCNTVFWISDLLDQAQM